MTAAQDNEGSLGLKRIWKAPPPPSLSSSHPLQIGLPFTRLSKSCAPWKKSPIAFGKDGIKSHSPPASAHCCRSFFHVWSQAYISKTNNLVSFLTVIHNANKTACERAWSPKRRLTARGGERKRKRERNEQLRLSAPCLIDFCLSSFSTAPPLPFSDCFSTLFFDTYP